MANVHVQEELLTALAEHVSCNEISGHNELGVIQLLDGDFMILFTTPGLQRAFYVSPTGDIKLASAARIERALEVL